jgi:hypothetical protein
MLVLNENSNKRLFVVDNFYENPDEIREFALRQEYLEDVRFYKGLRSVIPFRASGTKEAFENIIGQPIVQFDSGNNGCFQITSSENPQVYHCDEQTWAGIVYLTPNAPVKAGTRTHRSLRDWSRTGPETTPATFQTGFYDSHQFEIVDDIGNIYNRLVIFNGPMIHSAGPYFGNSMWNGRLIHLFFFD